MVKMLNSTLFQNIVKHKSQLIILEPAGIWIKH